MFRRNKKSVSKKAPASSPSSQQLNTKEPIPLADQETCAKYLKQRMDHLGLHEAKNYYQGLSTFVLHNRFIHLDVNIGTKQLIISTTIHEVVSSASENKKALDRTESFNKDGTKNKGALLQFKEQCVNLIRHAPISTLQTDAAFEAVIADFLTCAKEADTIFVGHKAIIDQEQQQQRKLRKTRKDTGLPKAMMLNDK